MEVAKVLQANQVANKWMGSNELYEKQKAKKNSMHMNPELWDLHQDWIFLVEKPLLQFVMSAVVKE